MCVVAACNCFPDHQALKTRALTAHATVEAPVEQEWQNIVDVARGATTNRCGVRWWSAPHPGWSAEW